MSKANKKKITVSQGLRGKGDPEACVAKCRRAAQDYYKNRKENVELTDTFFKDFDGNRLQFLGKSISEGLALADEIVFMDDWRNYDGCLAEHFIAIRYGVPIVYLNSQRY